MLSCQELVTTRFFMLKTNIYIPVLWFVMLGTSLFSQEVPTLSYFNITAGSKQVFLSWQLNAGATCLGMEIQRSEDGKSFEQVGKIGGICGDITKPISYSFIDETPPLNTTLYYRLELGQGAFTDTVKTELIDLNGFAIQIRPNPVKNNAKIYFSNESRMEHTLNLYDLTGRNLGSISSSESLFELENLSYPTGIYMYIIRSKDGTKNYSGKMMIVD